MTSWRKLTGGDDAFRSTVTGRVAVLPAALTVRVVLPEATGLTQPKLSTTATFSSVLAKAAEAVRSNGRPSGRVPPTRTETGCRGCVRVTAGGVRRRSPATSTSAAR